MVLQIRRKVLGHVLIRNVRENGRDASVGELRSLSLGCASLLVFPHFGTCRTTVGSPSSVIGNPATAITAIAHD